MTKTLAVAATLAIFAMTAPAFGKAPIWDCAPEQSAKACRKDVKEACTINHVPTRTCRAVRIYY